MKEAYQYVISKFLRSMLKNHCLFHLFSKLMVCHELVILFIILRFAVLQKGHTSLGFLFLTYIVDINFCPRKVSDLISVLNVKYFIKFYDDVQLHSFQPNIYQRILGALTLSRHRGHRKSSKSDGITFFVLRTLGWYPREPVKVIHRIR